MAQHQCLCWDFLECIGTIHRVKKTFKFLVFLKTWFLSFKLAPVDCQIIFLPGLGNNTCLLNLNYCWKMAYSVSLVWKILAKLDINSILCHSKKNIQTWIKWIYSWLNIKKQYILSFLDKLLFNSQVIERRCKEFI